MATKKQAVKKISKKVAKKVAKKKISKKVAKKKAAPKEVIAPAPAPAAAAAAVAKEEPKKDEVFMACKRSSDKLFMGQSCNSLKAYKMSRDGSSIPTFTCVKCRYTWSVPIGGTFIGC